MKYDANKYLERNLEKKDINEELIKLYSIVLKDLILKPTDIYYREANNSISILANYDKEKRENKYINIQFINIDKNGNLIIQLNTTSTNNRIQYNIGFDGNHYEISILNNFSRLDNHDKYSGVFYINKNISGLIKYKFYDYKSISEFSAFYKKEEELYYNDNCIYLDGFDPDYQFELESNIQYSKKSLAIELNELIKNFDINYSLNLFEKILNNYEPTESSVNYILK